MTQGCASITGTFCGRARVGPGGGASLGVEVHDISAACPASSAATAKLSARDVLPTPPFFETMTIVSMFP